MNAVSHDMNPLTPRLFTDGGLLGPNPCPLGGTWAWVLVEGGAEVVRASGVVLPSSLGRETVSNNNAELFALLCGLEALPDGWRGEVCGDNLTSLCWLFQDYRRENIPAPLSDRMDDLFLSGRLRGLRHRLFAGHPSKADLAAGFRVKKAPHYPVSEWNALCDRLCNEERYAWEATNGKPEAVLPKRQPKSALDREIKRALIAEASCGV